MILLVAPGRAEPRNAYQFLFCLLVAGILTTAVSGCDRQARHKVLTFFFTGVPSLEEQKKAEAEKVQIPEEPKIGRLAAPKPTLFSHPVWAAGLCDPCHQSVAGFRVPGVKKRSVQVFRKGGGSPGELVLPRQELCIKCHVDKSPAKVLAQGLWLHPISAKGDCMACHDPHQSQNPDVLLKTPQEICSPCHTEAEMMPKVKDKEAHQKPGECLSCHNPHLGKDRILLTKDYKEVKHPVGPVPGLPGSEASPGGLPRRGSTLQE